MPTTCRALLTATLAVVGISGCYSHTSYHHVNPLDAITGKYHEDIIVNQEVSVWLSSIESPGFDESVIDEKCPSKSGSIKKAKGFTSALVQLVTLGIYHSITVEIGCEKKAASAMTITPAQARALVASPRFVDIVRTNFPSMTQDAKRAHVMALAGQ